MADVKNIIKLLQLLSREEGVSLQELEEVLEMKDKGIYKNLTSLIKADIEVIKVKPGHWRIRQEELLGLFDLSSDDLVKVDQIKEAIIDDKCVNLIAYQNSKGYTGDFKVEPISLFDRNRRLWCFDLKDHQLKQFKLSRARSIEITTRPRYNKDRHLSVQCDIFGTASNEVRKISFLLTTLGYQLMRETYPESGQYLTEINTRNDNFIYKYEGEVFSYNGVGRFILGIPGHVKDIKPKSLLLHVQEEVKRSYYS
ncbi:helix-turn-helix transcriptional regulator [Flammeovirga aprica]|uniref:WYL domain-containing protein n=1 Tax=Flammeovirga aprica JL-4 TaxID=694437 RepID=A0A7X9RXI5_9BACT|nr:WYL domain-containing protein [Flammeovirga aprica]NME70545.1 WYL domain-containing protein [Flammeovirga aprica JL-4]